MENTIKPSKTPLILGILSLISFLMPIVCLPICITGIVISNKKMKLEKTKSYKVGLILNIVGLVLTLITWGVNTYILLNK